MRYVDDVLVVAPDDVNLDVKLQDLNTVDSKIQFTLEKEINGKLPFLDTMIMRNGHTAKFKVYRKPSNKEDYVHFFSGHSERVKNGIVIGFFLRAFRICSEDFLQEEINHIFQTFQRLHYPKGYLIRMKKKAEEIRSKSYEEKQKAKKEQRKRAGLYQFQTQDTLTLLLTAFVQPVLMLPVVSGMKIENLSRQKTKMSENNSVVYKIPCSGPCKKSYVGETGRGLKTRLNEHKRDVRNHNTSNAMVLHLENVNNFRTGPKHM